MLVLAAITLLSIAGYAFAYTYLLNKTDSVLLCILLHASFNVALASAGLRTEHALQLWDYILTLGLGAATIWAGVALLIKLTDGRLGRDVTAPLAETMNRAARLSEIWCTRKEERFAGPGSSVVPRHRMGGPNGWSARRSPVAWGHASRHHL